MRSIFTLSQTLLAGTILDILRISFFSNLVGNAEYTTRLLFLGFLFASGNVLAERQIASYQEFTAFLNDDQSCSENMTIIARHPSQDAFTEQRPQLKRLLDGVKILLNLECPRVRKVLIKGESVGKIAYFGAITSVTKWVLIDRPESADKKIVETSQTERKNLVDLTSGEAIILKTAIDTSAVRAGAPTILEPSSDNVDVLALNHTTPNFFNDNMCDALAAWVRPLQHTAETNRRGQLEPLPVYNEKEALERYLFLFEDRFFVPVFGKPIDSIGAWSRNKIIRALQYVGNNCGHRNKDKDISFLLSLHPGVYISRGFREKKDRRPRIFYYKPIVTHVQKVRKTPVVERISGYKELQAQCKELRTVYDLSKARVRKLFIEQNDVKLCNAPAHIPVFKRNLRLAQPYEKKANNALEAMKYLSKKSVLLSPSQGGGTCSTERLSIVLMTTVIPRATDNPMRMPHPIYGPNSAGDVFERNRRKYCATR